MGKCFFQVTYYIMLTRFPFAASINIRHLYFYQAMHVHLYSFFDDEQTFCEKCHADLV